MEWNEKLQMIIDYVEHHLQRVQEPIDPGEIQNRGVLLWIFSEGIFLYERHQLCGVCPLQEAYSGRI